MKVVAFNGSPRRQGNTAILIDKVLAELRREGIETEVFHMSGRKIHGCRACYTCAKNKDRRCSVKTDVLNECLAKMEEADGIILGSPVYFSNVTTEMKALIDRAGLVAKVNGDMLRRKVGAAVVADRRAGAVTTFDALNHFFLINQMIVPGSCYWNMAYGREPGEVEGDEEGMRIMKVLGENLAWTLKRMHE